MKQEIRNRDIKFVPLNDQFNPQFIQLYSESIWGKRKAHSCKPGRDNKMLDDINGKVYMDSTAPDICPVGNILFHQGKKTPRQLNSDVHVGQQTGGSQ